MGSNPTASINNNVDEPHLSKLFFDLASTSGKRAIKEHTNYKVLRIDDEFYHVMRKGDALRTYDVILRGDRGACSCAGFLYGMQTLDDRNPCLHIYIVKKHIAAVSQQQATGLPNRQ